MAGPALPPCFPVVFRRAVWGEERMGGEREGDEEEEEDGRLPLGTVEKSVRPAVGTRLVTSHTRGRGRA